MATEHIIGWTLFVRYREERSTFFPDTYIGLYSPQAMEKQKRDVYPGKTNGFLLEQILKGNSPLAAKTPYEGAQSIKETVDGIVQDSGHASRGMYGGIGRFTLHPEEPFVQFCYHFGSREKAEQIAEKLSKLSGK